MHATGPRLDPDEFARLSADVYPRLVLPHLRPEDHGKFVVFDVESGAFEVDDSLHAAAARLHERIPGVQAWAERVGFPSVHKFGFRGGDDPRHRLSPPRARRPPAGPRADRTDR
jgi:hypothetical protein